MRARFPSAVALVCAAACGGEDVGGGTASSRTGGPIGQLLSPGQGFATGRAADVGWVYFAQYDVALQRPRLVRASSLAWPIRRWMTSIFTTSSMDG